MRHFSIVLVTTVLGLLGTHSAVSHHARGLYYDSDNVVEYEGVTAVAFNIVNPHSQLVFLMEDAEGNEVQWIADAHSASHLRRAGVPLNLISAGDKLTVRGNPSRSGSNAIWLLQMVLPNGDVANFSDAIRGGRTRAITPAGGDGNP